MTNSADSSHDHNARIPWTPPNYHKRSGTAQFINGKELPDNHSSLDDLIVDPENIIPIIPTASYPPHQYSSDSDSLRPPSCPSLIPSGKSDLGTSKDDDSSSGDEANEDGQNDEEDIENQDANDEDEIDDDREHRNTSTITSTNKPRGKRTIDARTNTTTTSTANAPRATENENTVSETPAPVPIYFEGFPRDKFIRVYTLHLEGIVSHTFQSPSPKDPRIGKKEFLELTIMNLHRLLIAAVTVAVKLLEDRVFSNRHYGRVGGVQTSSEMTRMEAAFLKYIDYNIHVDQESYYAVLNGKLKPLYNLLVSANESQVREEGDVTEVMEQSSSGRTAINHGCEVDEGESECDEVEADNNEEQSVDDNKKCVKHTGDTSPGHTLNLRRAALSGAHGNRASESLDCMTQSTKAISINDGTVDVVDSNVCRGHHGENIKSSNNHGISKQKSIIRGRPNKRRRQTDSNSHTHRGEEISVRRRRRS